MQNVEEYLHLQPQEFQKSLWELHLYLTEQCGLEPKIKFNIPFYYGRTWVCYINVHVKSQSFEFCFLNGIEMSTQWERLEMRGRQMVAGVVFKCDEKVIGPQLEEAVQEALILDEGL